MSEFKNAQELWRFIREDTVKGDPKRKYTTEAFFKDLNRSYGELYINGKLSDSILDKAHNQINAVEKGIHAIHSAIEKIKKNLDIKEACQEIASIEGIETNLFETGLLDATQLLGKFDPIGVEFRNFCEIRRYILPLRSELNKGNLDKGLEEKLTRIKNKLLSITPVPLLLGERQIEAMFLNEAANEIFNPLFENKKVSELNNEGEAWKFKENAQKDCFKKFLKLFLHQNFIFSNATILNILGNGHYVFGNPTKRIELSYSDDSLFLQESLFTQKVMDVNTNEVFKTKGEDFFVKGKTKYKINIQSHNGGWIAKYDLIDSTLECKEKFKAILDTRNILEKIQEFLVTNFDKIIAYLNLDKPVKNKPKFKPLFFVSNTGSSVSEVISDNTESNGNILNITINSMK
jgi:hypothetical protein